MENKNLPRDVFLYLLSIVALITSAVSLGILVFQYINMYFPDIVTDYYATKSMYLSPIRQSLATLVVIFPVYLWVAWFLRRDLKEFPEKRELKIRKWLLYLTVFVAGLVIIGDLVTLLNAFLNGEITARFVLKVLTILFIAGTSFFYYYLELRTKKPAKENVWHMKVFPGAVISVVIVAVVLGFYVAGSPTSQRLVRLDERRVSDLQFVQSQIINYWQKKAKLPENLSELQNDILGISIPKDPTTGGEYAYSVLSKFKFEVCANFDTVSESLQITDKTRAVPVAPGGYDSFQSWNHDKGYVCFSRTIDPDLFPLIKEIPVKY